MSKLTVWTAAATYGPEADIGPIVGVGLTKEAAEANLQWRLMVHCQEDAECIEQWIAHEAEEHQLER
jgi:hypothetical protein